ncbi:sensor histidine kinase [Sphingomicrobium marinum]|uniref:sensor histidine kinase n=1 Tax=Sphingomicrobium marinum TaxID=1227950 RepID=UPI0022407FD6|nr:histidine kinase dimerization/phospho-acceptor domain-containing protein [Sphingomicrobium marinum]
MRFDDRIATILTLPGSDPHDVAVRWRQLVDVVSRAGPDEETSAPFIAALAVIRADAERVPLAARAAAARAIAGRPLSDDLIAVFAADRLAVNAPILAAVADNASLRERLLKVAGNDTRRFLETLSGEEDHEEETQKNEEAKEEPIKEPAPAPDVAPSGDPISIQDMVNRIEGHLQAGRVASGTDVSVAPEPISPPKPAPAATPSTTAPASEPAAQSARFSWTSDRDGEITHVEGAPRAALIGRDLTSGAPEAMRRALAANKAFADIILPAMGADWRWNGTPVTDADGNFAGYEGYAERRVEAPAQGASKRDPQSLRELAHEIRTPLNAIIGFAEIIDGEYLGPADTPYRQRAAHIVAQARILLGAIEDLDFAARLQAGQEDEKPTPLGELIKPFKPVWKAAAKDRGVGLSVPKRKTMQDAVIDAGLAGRLIDRVMTSLIGAAEEAQHTGLLHDIERDHVRIAFLRPASLAGLAATDLLDPALDFDGKLVGLGFSLRLVRGLARIAAGDLIVDRDALILILPRAA